MTREEMHAVFDMTIDANHALHEKNIEFVMQFNTNQYSGDTLEVTVFKRNDDGGAENSFEIIDKCWTNEYDACTALIRKYMEGVKNDTV